MFFLMHITDLPDDIICNLAVYADDTTLLWKSSWWYICNLAVYADDTTLLSRCDRASDLWQYLG